jgi:hypothetical protein
MDVAPFADLPIAIVSGTGINVPGDAGTPQQLLNLDHFGTNDGSTFASADGQSAITILIPGIYKVDCALGHYTDPDAFYASIDGVEDLLKAAGQTLRLGSGSYVNQSFHLYQLVAPATVKMYVETAVDLVGSNTDQSMTVYRLVGENVPRRYAAAVRERV